jgi:hypothetical protein
MNCILEKFPGNLGGPRGHLFSDERLSNGEEEERMTPPLAHDPPNALPDEGPAVSRLTAAQAHELVAAGRGVLVDTRDARLFENAHAAGALSLPLSTIEAAHGQVPASPLPPDRVLILYCA